MMLVAALALTSCLSGEKQETKVERQVEVTYTVTCNQDMIDGVNLVVTYKDKGGVNVNDTINDTIWTKTVVSDVIPFKVGLDWTLSAKADAQIKKDTIDLLARCSIKCKEVTIRPLSQMFRYHDIPVSKLAPLCDYENVKHANYYQDENNFCCVLIKPNRGSGLDITTEPANWND